MSKNFIEVVAALIFDNENRFMICRRPKNKARGGLWEFAGGKVEKDETKADALKRECTEELNITVEVSDEFADVFYEYPDINIHLTLFNTRIKDGKPKLNEHTEIRFIKANEIPKYDFCPADRPLLNRLTGELRRSEPENCADRNRKTIKESS